ncbi:hypothetical protein [Variovorax rhizosphaerae]|uniref:GAF domain-containing protein n=1 Tax=Variovorax rhizosphaerae TaxID=1836200 RepID=A0ABU8WEV7_9BURK
MQQLDVDLRIASIRSVLATDGVVSALATLNDKTEYRYTGLFKLRGAGMCAIFLFDRATELRPRQRVTPLRTSVWRRMLQDGEFMTNSASEDSRLSPHDRTGSLESCFGRLLQPVAGTVPCGVLIHFDVERRNIDPAEALILRTAAPLFLSYLNWSE